METLSADLKQVQQTVGNMEQEKEQLHKNLLAESRQLNALRAEMDQLRERFKSQEDNHLATIANLQKVHENELNKLKAEATQSGVTTGTENGLSPSQQVAMLQVKP